MSEGWAIDIFNFMVAILCLCYSNVATQVLIWTLDLLQSSKVFSKIKSSKTKPHEFIFWFKKKKSDNAEDYRYILSKIASQNNN